MAASISPLADAPKSGASPSSSGLLANSRLLIVFLLSLLVIRLVFMAWLPLTDTTEARYAEIARKMMETGDWITPQFDYGVPFWAKPPLHTWASALGMKLFGVSPFAARLFIFSMSLCVLAIVYHWVKRTLDAKTALVAVTICASSVMFFGASAFVMTDMAMVLGTTLSMVGFYNAVEGRSRHGLWSHMFFVGLAIGLLAKGPTAVVLTGIPIFLWLLLRRRWTRLARIQWLAGILIALALAGPWYIAAELKAPGFLRYFLIGEHIERFLVPGWQGDLYGSGHREPKGMIWVFAAGVFLPWTFLVIAIALRPVKLIRTLMRSDQGFVSYLMLWLLAPLLLFTPAANILAAYVLPAVPAFSVLLALLVTDHTYRNLHWVQASIALCLISSLGFFSYITWASRHAPEALGLRTMDGLVRTIRGSSPKAQISVYPSRSYSAEFYTKGAAQTLDEIEALSQLSANGIRDAVIVSLAHHDAAQTVLGPAFEKIATYRKHVAFLEREK